MVFFQAVLLGGYLFARFSTSRIAAELGLECRTNAFAADSNAAADGASSSIWVAVGRNESSFADYNRKWAPTRADAALWTDDHSDVFGALG